MFLSISNVFFNFFNSGLVNYRFRSNTLDNILELRLHEWSLNCPQVIAVILAVFLHHGNGRAITSTSNDHIETMLDIAKEELNTVLNKTSEKPTEREENPADLLRLSEPDSPSHEALQFQFSDDVSGESANKGSDNVTLPKEASPVLRQKRSHTGPCYTGNHQTVQLASGRLATFPICRKVSLIGCSSSIANNKNNKRLCVASLTPILIRGDDGTNRMAGFPTSCSCAP